MIKIEAGKYYRTTDGKKVGPMMPSLKVDWPWIVSLGDGFCWHDDGSPVAYTESPRLIAEWLDGVPLKVEPKLWRDMTPEEKGALMLAHHEGKVIESFANGEWRRCSPTWQDHCTYRIKPLETKVTMYGEQYSQVYWGFDNGSCLGDYRITFDLVDGEPDCDSIRMEKLCQKGES